MSDITDILDPIGFVSKWIRVLKFLEQKPI